MYWITQSTRIDQKAQSPMMMTRKVAACNPEIQTNRLLVQNKCTHSDSTFGTDVTTQVEIDCIYVSKTRWIDWFMILKKWNGWEGKNSKSRRKYRWNRFGDAPLKGTGGVKGKKKRMKKATEEWKM